MLPEYKYDVAFSFLDKDHALAVSIRDKLFENISVFVYSEHQAELAGKDGEEIFNRVFGSEARIVIVLYREGWGDSPWTRIEKTAIQNRAMVEGYDFTVFVLLDEKGKPLPWIPKNRIWYNYQKFGIDGIAASIESRVQEMGGNAKPRSLEENAASINLTIANLKKRTEFLNSDKSLKPANDEYLKIKAFLDQKANQVASSNKELNIRVKEPDRTIELYCQGFRLVLVWHRQYGNSLIDSGLYAYFAEVKRDQRSFDPKYQDVQQNEYNFWLDESDQTGWREKASKKFYTSEYLAESLLTHLIQLVKTRQLEKLDPS